MIQKLSEKMNEPFWRGFELGIYMAHALASVPMIILGLIFHSNLIIGWGILAGLFGTWAWHDVYHFAWRVPEQKK